MSMDADDPILDASRDYDSSPSVSSARAASDPTPNDENEPATERPPSAQGHIGIGQRHHREPDSAATLLTGQPQSDFADVAARNSRALDDLMRASTAPAPALSGGAPSKRAREILENYETVACNLRTLGAGELADAERMAIDFIANLEATLTRVTAERDEANQQADLIGQRAQRDVTILAERNRELKLELAAARADTEKARADLQAIADTFYALGIRSIMAPIAVARSVSPREPNPEAESVQETTMKSENAR